MDKIKNKIIIAAQFAEINHNTMMDLKQIDSLFLD